MFKKYAALHWLWFCVGCYILSGLIAGFKMVIFGDSRPTVAEAVSDNLLWSGLLIILIQWSIIKAFHIFRKPNKEQNIETAKT